MMTTDSIDQQVDNIYDNVVNVRISNDRVQIHFHVEREWRDIADGLRSLGLLDNVSDELAAAYKRLLLERIALMDPTDERDVPSTFYRNVETVRDQLAASTHRVVSKLSDIADAAEVIEKRELQKQEQFNVLKRELEDWFVEINIGMEDKKTNPLYAYSLFAKILLDEREIRALTSGSFSAQLKMGSVVSREHPEMARGYNTLIEQIEDKYSGGNMHLFLSFVDQVIKSGKI